MFDLVELEHSASVGEEGEGKVDASVTARLLDIEKTFSPSPRLPYIGAKLFLMTWVISVMALSIKNAIHQSFWLAFLTHWGLVLTSLYFIMSVVCAVYFAMHPPENTGELKGGVGLLVKTTWALFAIVLPAEVVITLLFWVLQFDGTATYVDVMAHAVVMVLIAIDGILSRIPLRMKQLLIYEVFTALYVIWNVVHAYSGIGNPYVDDGSQDDDAIYPSLKWKKNPGSSTILSVLVLFVVNPIVFMLCRAVLRLFPRRLYENSDKERKTHDGNDEEAVVVY